MGGLERCIRQVAGVTVLAAAVHGACGGGGSPTAPEGGGPGALQPSGASPSAATCFDGACLHETRLALDPAAWQSLRDNYATNQYYAADIEIDGTAVAQVGIRSRGGGTRNETKPGLRVDFDRYVAGQHLQGYGSLVLDNLWSDPTLVRERLAFAVFEAMGFPAPRNAFTRLFVNGEYWGLYAVVEPVARPFLERALGEKSGHLFEYEWAFAWDFSWRGADAAAYVPVPFKPETDEDDPAGSAGVLALVSAVNLSTDDALPGALAPLLDVDRLLAYVAVENAVAEADGFLGEWGMNNFYLYRLGGGGRFVLVPWDKDASFVATSWPVHRNLEANVLTRRLVSDPAGMRAYEDAVRRAVSEFVNPRWLGPRCDAAWAQVHEASRADGRKQYTDDQVEAAMASLRRVVEMREADVKAQLGGAP